MKRTERKASEYVELVAKNGKYMSEFEKATRRLYYEKGYKEALEDARREVKKLANVRQVAGLLDEWLEGEL